MKKNIHSPHSSPGPSSKVPQALFVAPPLALDAVTVTTVSCCVTSVPIAIALSDGSGVSLKQAERLLSVSEHVSAEPLPADAATALIDSGMVREEDVGAVALIHFTLASSPNWRPYHLA